MTALETIHNAIKEGMTVFDYSPDGDEIAKLFKNAVGKKGKVISLVPGARTVAVDDLLETNHIDIVYANVRAKTLPFLGGAEDTLRRDRPIVLLRVNAKIVQKHGYEIKDILDFMLSAGFMNMRVDTDFYVFTYEFHPSDVIL